MPRRLSEIETAWTRMRRAKLDTPEGRAAVGEIVQAYWEPLYYYVRHKGLLDADAQDAVQGFVEHVLETKLIQKADPEKGSFRGLLKTSFDNWRRQEHRRSAAQKRGGDAQRVELDFQTAETRYRAQVDPSLSPEQVLEQEWAASFCERVSAQLGEYYARKKRLDRFEALLPFVFEPPEYGDYTKAGKPLGMTGHHVRVFVERLIEDWADLAVAEAATMLGSVEKGDEEIRALGFGRVLDEAGRLGPQAG